MWHHIEVDGGDLLKTRTKQKLQLARYGRQPFLAREWDDVCLEEFRGWYDALKELLDEESEVSRALEDR